MGFPRQEYWSGLPFPSPGDLLDPGIQPRPPALQMDSLPLATQEATIFLGSTYKQHHMSFVFLCLTYISSVQFRSIAQSCPTLCNPMDCSTQRFPVHHQLLDLAKAHVHRVSDAIQPSHPPSSPSPLAFSLSQHQVFFQWLSSSHQVAKVLELQLQHQSFQWIFRIDFLQDWLVWSPCSPRDSQESSPTLKWLTSLSTTISRSIHVSAHGIITFFFSTAE